MPEAKIARRILDQDLTAERDLCLVDVPAKELEALVGVRQRQEVVEVHAARDAPREVLRHQHGLDASDQRRDPVQMARVKTIGAAEREAHAVKRDWIAGPELVEASERRPPSEIVLGMDLEPRGGRASVDDFVDMWRTQSDACRRRRAASVCIAPNHPATRPPVAPRFDAPTPSWAAGFPPRASRRCPWGRRPRHRPACPASTCPRRTNWPSGSRSWLPSRYQSTFRARTSAPAPGRPARSSEAAGRMRWQWPL